MNKNKKVWEYFAIVLFVVFLVPTSVFAATVYTEGNLLYIIEDGGITITGYTGDSDVVDIPDNIAGYPISKVAAGAFSDKDSVKTVNLPETIMEVEPGAFSDTQNVTNIELANVETIKKRGNSGDITESLSINESVAQNYTSAASEEVEEGVSNLDEEHSVNGYIVGDSLITVDDNSHLIRIDSKGRSEMLDSENQYSVNSRQDGTVAIVRADGVALDPEDIPEPKEMESESIKASVQGSANETADKIKTESEKTLENTKTTGNGGSGTIIIIAIIIVAIAGAVVLLVSKTKKNKG